MDDFLSVNVNLYMNVYQPYINATINIIFKRVSTIK